LALAPEIRSSLFSSTSPDEPSFSILQGPISPNWCRRWPKPSREGVPCVRQPTVGAGPDPRHLTPETCLSLFSSTSPDEPSFSMYCSRAVFAAICPQLPERRREGGPCVRQPTVGAGPDTRHLTPETCLSLFSSTSPDEPAFSMYCSRAVFAQSAHNCRNRDGNGCPAFGNQQLALGLTLGTRPPKPALHCFHQHPRMNLHFR
jgi:hypothetical protein